MCWFVHFTVVLQKDTPHARSQLQPLHDKNHLLAGAFPNFSIPRGICGCPYVHTNGTGVSTEIPPLLSHFLHQPPVKRLELWWHWTKADEDGRPSIEETLSWAHFLARNTAYTLAPEIRYRISLPRHFPPSS